MNPDREIRLMATLWPSFPHFPAFATDPRLSGLRLNSAMVSGADLERELETLRGFSGETLPLWFDVKGWQLRVERAVWVTEDGHELTREEMRHRSAHHIELVMNHPISVKTPVEVLFKAGEDGALLVNVEDGGRRLVFASGAEFGPYFEVEPGESLHIRHPSLAVSGEPFTEAERAKVARAKEFGFTRWFLSYVRNRRYVDEFLEMVGQDAEVMLKIEDHHGLRYVRTEFEKRENLTLVLAQGDLFVEVMHPADILDEAEAVIAADPDALAGSRLLLSCVDVVREKRSGGPQPALHHRPPCRWFLPFDAERDGHILRPNPRPSCSDWQQLGFLHGIGYRNFMLCDEICLAGDMLETAVARFDEFRENRRRRAGR